MSWIEITTNLPCTNKCRYCPQDVLMGVYKGDLVLSLDRFKRCLNNVPQDVEVRFAGFSEPFLNPECIDMIEYARDGGHSLHLFTTLVGLTDEQAERLSKITFAKLRVHDIGQEIKYSFTGEDKSPVTNVISRAGNLFKTEPREVSGCSRSPQYDGNIMLPNGDVAICCNDYGLTAIIGNLERDNFRDLIRTGKYEVCRYCEYAR
jgi:MoaA/NifB/PqqE/SkfB family radical SAM enzyme